MKTKLFGLFLCIGFLVNCSLKRTKQPNFVNSIYSYQEPHKSYEIHFINDSLLVLTQTFHCSELPEALRSKEIFAHYSIESKKQVIRTKKLAPYNFKKLEYFEGHLTNLSDDTIAYPFIEVISEECSFFNSRHRSDRYAFDGRMMFSTFKKYNIIDFRNKSFTFRLQDSVLVLNGLPFKMKMAPPKK